MEGIAKALDKNRVIIPNTAKNNRDRVAIRRVNTGRLKKGVVVTNDGDDLPPINRISSDST